MPKPKSQPRSRSIRSRTSRMAQPARPARISHGIIAEQGGNVDSRADRSACDTALAAVQRATRHCRRRFCSAVEIVGDAARQRVDHPVAPVATSAGWRCRWHWRGSPARPAPRERRAPAARRSRPAAPGSAAASTLGSSWCTMRLRGEVGLLAASRRRIRSTRMSTTAGVGLRHGEAGDDVGPVLARRPAPCRARRWRSRRGCRRWRRGFPAAGSCRRGAR